MPIYEFYCPVCNTVFNFLSRKINTQTVPPCPRCSKDTLQRQASLFATPKSRNHDTCDDPMDQLPIDETKMEHAMQRLAGEVDGIDENDPRQAARLMQKLSDMTGLKYNDSIQEAIDRMEAGEDPEKVEESMGDTMDDEMPFKLPGSKQSTQSRPPRTYDPKLYEM